MNEEEKDKYLNLINTLCVHFDKIINENVFKEVEYKKNIAMVSSFLEFLKSGASINCSIKDDKVEFIVDLH